MTKRFFSIGAAALLLTGFVVGCQDSVVDSAQSSDPYAMYAVDESAMTDFSEVLSVDESLDNLVVLDPGHDSTRGDDTLDRGHRDTTDRGHHGDTLRGGGPGSGRDTAIRPDRGGRGPGHDRGHAWGRLEPRSYGRILNQLNLTADQKTAIRVCFADYRTCVEGDAAAYRTARGEAHDAMAAGIAEVRAAVAAGTMTADEARAAVRALGETYRTDVAALNAAFKAAVQACQDGLDTCIVGHLTAEQVVIWNRLHG